MGASEIVLETAPKMFSRNEEIIKEEMPTVEDTPPVSASQKSKEEEELDKIIAKESTNLQWAKLALNFGMLVLMVVCMILRGPGRGRPSVIGVHHCEAGDFIFLAIILVGAVLATFIAYLIAKSEYNEKKNVGYTFVKGDLEFTGVNTFKLVLIAFTGAFLATAVGLGPGAVFVPVLVQLDMHSGVASSTGMYLTMFTALAATINMIVFNAINVKYMLILCALTIVASVPGIWMQGFIRIKAGGRT